MNSRRLVLEGYVRRPASPRNVEVVSIIFASAAAQRGWRVVRILKEESGSARLDEALGRVESTETDGLVVARLADLGANLPEAVAAIDRIRAAGGTLLSVEDSIELGPNTGASIWRLLVSLAEW